MKSTKRLWVAVVVGILGATSAGRAALSAATNAHVSFLASGPAGLKIEGTTADLTVADDGSNVVITVPLANLSTGIGLRDHHMKEKYLEVEKYPAAVLTIARTALKWPKGDDKAVADAPGTMTLHGQTRPVTVHYEAKGEGASFAAKGSCRLNMNEFGITVPVYLGVTVKPDVDVTADFRVSGP